MNALLARAKRLLPKEDYEIVKSMADTIALLSRTMGAKNAHIRKLLKMLFGTVTEKTSKVLKEKREREKADKKPGGHGRNGADTYKGAQKIIISHKTLKPKDRCPACKKGKLYDTKKPSTIVRITGQPPLAAKIYEIERLRCSLCGKVFKAEAPEGIGDEKYDSASGAMVALLKYGSGLPFNRLEGLQESLGVPLAASTQWDIVEEVADKIVPAYRKLIEIASQGDVIHNDDTVMKILEKMKTADGDKKGRKGIFTSGFASIASDTKIALFFTGRSHAGENMANLLAKRKSELAPPIQMCDGLSRNVPKDFEVILSNCIAHGRRRFVDIGEAFPGECGYVLKVLEKVYKNDAYTKDMDPDQRLKYHKDNSSKLMDDLKDWLTSQLEDKKVEPNSSLGEAISYMLKHYKGMTLFLRKPKAPLDNNLCERILKKAILHRKNSLFYKTEHGAYVGDLFMSLIHTCSFCGTNPFEYLKALQENSSSVLKDPGKWLPYNYDKMPGAEAK